MKYISLDFLCKSCQHRTWETIPRDDAFSYTPECPQCSAQMIKVPSAPRVMRASYPDGTNRFADFKEAAKLESAMYDLPESERAGIKKEIKKIEEIKK